MVWSASSWWSCRRWWYSGSLSVAAMADALWRSFAEVQRRWRRCCSRNLGSRMVAGASQGSFVGSSSPEFQICDEEWRLVVTPWGLMEVCGGSAGDCGGTPAS
ncbi:hypothetical protein DEO72_LG6g622 [Vigna unguiculata]|uniref:Uncharacterized protein n=1 Tax=Vigna unguiculata TaxID=3917 RepID=A0A4D6M7R6_VIGUN|nr:hypothetical protein DEO72_LG6g622 [Vigna unguiculata]